MTTNGSSGTQKLPLEGLRILDFTVVWAGPYSTMQLADWGAEVIRIESLQHFASTTRGVMARPPVEMVRAQSWLGYPDDDAGERPWNRYSVFNHHGRNKRAITVDMTRPEGQEVFDKLLRISDGVIENNVPVSMERLGVTWERVSAVNPNAVMIRMPAFGLTGPYQNYRTWGNHMEALSGHPLIRTYPDLTPEYAPQGVPADAAAGIGAAFAFLLGLRQRRKIGKGVLIEAATAENFVPLLGDFVMDYTMNGRVWTQMGNDHWYLAPHNVYRCQGQDAWVTIAVENEDQWVELCRVMRMESLAGDTRFVDMESRHANRIELDSIIGEWTTNHQAHWVMNRLQQVKVPSGVVMNEKEALKDKHLHERGFWHPLTHPEAGTYQYVNTPWKASKTPNIAPRRHAPRLGEDNEYIYKEVLGFSEDEYRQFEETGHIGMDYDPSVP